MSFLTFPMYMYACTLTLKCWIINNKRSYRMKCTYMYYIVNRLHTELGRKFLALYLTSCRKSVSVTWVLIAVWWWYLTIQSQKKTCKWLSITVFEVLFSVRKIATPVRLFSTRFGVYWCDFFPKGFMTFFN